MQVPRCRYPGVTQVPQVQVPRCHPGTSGAGTSGVTQVPQVQVPQVYQVSGAGYQHPGDTQVSRCPGAGTQVSHRYLRCRYPGVTQVTQVQVPQVYQVSGAGCQHPGDTQVSRCPGFFLTKSILLYRVLGYLRCRYPGVTQVPRCHPGTQVSLRYPDVTQVPRCHPGTSGAGTSSVPGVRCSYPGVRCSYPGVINRGGNGLSLLIRTLGLVIKV